MLDIKKNTIPESIEAEGERYAVVDKSSVGYNFSLASIILPIEYKDLRLSKTEKQNIENMFCDKFEDVFKRRINSKGLVYYHDDIYDIMYHIFNEEIKGILGCDGIKREPGYYDQLNTAIAFALHNRLSRKTWRYGGFSVSQISYDIYYAAAELARSDSKADTTYGIIKISDNVVKKIQQVFLGSREEMKARFIEEALR